MRKVLITCPFTGLEFEALEYLDGRFIATNPTTGEDVHVTYNSSCDRYMIPPDAFKHVPLMTLAECADALGISKPRASVLASEGRLKAVRPGSTLYVTEKSVLEFKAQAKQRKEGSDGTGIGEPDR